MYDAMTNVVALTYLTSSSWAATAFRNAPFIMLSRTRGPKSGAHDPCCALIPSYRWSENQTRTLAVCVFKHPKRADSAMGHILPKRPAVMLL
ncbi:hypothetical protein C8Q78DRAFT_771922 [Trametes maxima]|nr:hypothetical protein C8Q78DRAFT_771922 [Trametes maxima]